MSVHLSKIKQIVLTVDPDEAGAGEPVALECQIRSWNLTPPQEDGERIYTQCPDGEVIEDADPVWSLEITFLSDWTAAGVSDFLMTNTGKVADFVLEHHPDIPAEHVQWAGKLKLKAPPIGGETRAREEQTVTFPCIGEPAYSRVGA